MTCGSIEEGKKKKKKLIDTNTRESVKIERRDRRIRKKKRAAWGDGKARSRIQRKSLNIYNVIRD